MVMAISACEGDVTVTEAVAVLFAEVGSVVVVLTPTELVMTVAGAVPAITLATKVNVAVAPLATEAFEQTMAPVEPTAGVTHVQPAGVVPEDT
jgi:hypothetical protein